MWVRSLFLNPITNWGEVFYSASSTSDSQLLLLVREKCSGAIVKKNGD